MKTAMAAVILFLIVVFSVVPVQVTALGGSASTIAVVYGGNVTVCGITSESRSSGGIKCWQGNQVTDVFPNVSFDYLAGGRDLFCGLISGGFTLLCFDSTFRAKRLYHNQTIGLKDLTVGDSQICALTNGTRNARCWRGGGGIPPTFSSESDRFISLSSGIGFSCGVLMNSNRVVCRGSNRELASLIEAEFMNTSMNSIIAGGNFACGLSLAGFVVCRGRNESGQLNVPQNNNNNNSVVSWYSSLALGNSHGCAIRNSNGSVVCWGNHGDGVDDNISFESIVAGFNFTCGLITSNLSVICWGFGWPSPGMVLPLGQVLPGPCVQSDCGQCGIYLQSQSLCFSSGNICKTCDLHIPPPTDDSVPPQPSPASHSKGLRKGLLAFAIIGSIGTVSGICTLLYCLWTGACCGHKKIHNSVQPTIAVSNSNNGRTSNNNNNNPFSRSSTLRRQGSRMMMMRRQRSGTSSFKHPERAEEFSFQDLLAATNNFAPENKIGAGSFGVVYRGKLLDGREVAIKRGDTDEQLKKFQEKESAFDSELAFLSRLHHKHLVGLVGYCEEGHEKLLVYDYMKNGALYDHLHHKDYNINKDDSVVNKDDNVLNSWKMRISIALDASRGIEYLHNYAVPPIIHRDIKSSNILLDSNWTARVSDFGLSLLGPQSDRDFRPTKAAGTVGYIDPEYYGLNVLTTKSDVYGLGIVLLELLTGKRAIFKNGGEPTSVVDFAVPAILSGELRRILDARVGVPSEGNEAEAVELVAYAAVQCVNMEGKHRPTMSDMVTNLERALGMLVGSNGSINSGPMSIVSD